jgi:hypothetical protein
MNQEERAKKVYFQHEVTKLICDCKTDTEFHKRLLWVLELVTGEICRYAWHDEAAEE